MGPDAVIAEVTAAGLRGRGGAGFPTGPKWQFARRTVADEKYVICNADEGDPGAFMNRSVLEGDPHTVLEGLVIAGLAVGARKGYVYARAEYPLAIEHLHKALVQMRASGLLGKNILGLNFDFDILIKQGAGAFVCGEETALMASIEGRRGMPRSRPPFPAVSGLFGKPTNINNVETLAAVAAILQNGAAEYARHGTEKSRGTKTFSLAGKIERTGLIEVPLGMTLRTIVEEIGGGVLDGKKFKAVQTGGPSGGCIPAHLLDLQVDYEHLAEAGSIMGSGGMVVMDENSCMVDVARYFLSFTEAESCGKCVPCRMGTQHLLRILTDICQGRGTQAHLVQLQRIGQTMKKASLCGLGQTAPNPVITTLRYFPEEYEAHITHRSCTAGVCRELIEFSIDPEKCSGCTACALACPVESISGGKKQAHVIDTSACIRCGTCRTACRFNAVRIGARSIPEQQPAELLASVNGHALSQ
jgi:NADH:ubiquinone oxidoreductase subunit F (NADH-binding)/ferredoxin